MWAPLRRILNRSTADPEHAATNRPACSGHIVGQPIRPPHGNQRPHRAQPQRDRVNRGPFIGIYRTAHTSDRAGNPVDPSATSANANINPAAIRAASTGGNARLRPWHLRNRRFRVRWRGLDPVEVYAFLNRAATDLTSVYAELAAAREETQRIKDALRQWQTQQAPTAYDLAAGARR